MQIVDEHHFREATKSYRDVQFIPPCPLKFFRCLWNCLKYVWLMMALLSRKIALCFPFHTPRFQVMDGSMSLASCPQVRSQALKCFRSSERGKTLEVALPTSLPREGRHLIRLFCPPVYLRSNFPSPQHVQSFWRWTSTIDTFQSGFPFHFLYQAHWIWNQGSN